MDSWMSVLAIQLIGYLFLGIQNPPFLRYSILALTLKSLCGGTNAKPSCEEDSSLVLRFHSSSPLAPLLLAQSGPMVSWIETLFGCLTSFQVGIHSVLFNAALDAIFLQLSVRPLYKLTNKCVTNIMFKALWCCVASYITFQNSAQHVCTIV